MPKTQKHACILSIRIEIVCTKVPKPSKILFKKRYIVIGLRKTLLSIRFRCFLCHRFDAQNIQPLVSRLHYHCACLLILSCNFLLLIQEMIFLDLSILKTPKQAQPVLRPHFHMHGHTCRTS